MAYAIRRRRDHSAIISVNKLKTPFAEFDKVGIGLGGGGGMGTTALLGADVELPEPSDPVTTQE
jgi:hypothetical protein